MRRTASKANNACKRTGKVAGVTLALTWAGFEIWNRMNPDGFQETMIDEETALSIQMGDLNHVLAMAGAFSATVVIGAVGCLLDTTCFTLGIPNKLAACGNAVWKQCKNARRAPTRVYYHALAQQPEDQKQGQALEV